MGHVHTTMPGTVVKVLVEVGDEVTAGQAVLVAEAMKMETEIQARVDGKVEAIFVKAGESIYSVSKKYNIKMQSIKKWNRLSSRSILKIGQVLVLADPTQANK